MDTSLGSWVLTIGAALIMTAFLVGHGQAVVDVFTVAGDVAWWLVRPLGPAS